MNARAGCFTLAIGSLVSWAIICVAIYFAFKLLGA